MPPSTKANPWGKRIMIGGIVLAILGVVISVAASAAKHDLASNPSPSPLGNLPSSAGQWLGVISQDLTSAGAAATAGDASYTAKCTQLRSDIESAGSDDGWTPGTGKTSTGLDAIYVEVLNQGHQSAEACIAGDDAGVITHAAAATAALDQLSSSLGH